LADGDTSTGGPSKRGSILPGALALALAFVLQLAFAPAGAASTGTVCAPTGLESVATERPAYEPGSLVEVAGSGYEPGCDVVVKVTRPDDLVVTGDGSQTPGSDTVSTDPFGNFTYQYQLQSVPAIEGQYLIDVLGSGETVLAHTSFADAAVLRLYLDAAHSAANEDYIFERGNTVFANVTGLQGNRSYKLEVFDPANVSRHVTTSCVPGSAGSFSDSFQTFASDPLSTDAAHEWAYVLHEWNSPTGCSGTLSDTTVDFDLAQATAYADSALTTPRSAFAVGASSFVKVEGLFPAKNSWNVSWLLPSAATACSNTGGGDRPSSNANGILSDTSAVKFIQYLPNNAAGDVWNKQSSYDAACPAFSGVNQGAWKLRLLFNSTHFVTLNVFSVDTTPPGVTIDQTAAQGDPTTSSPIQFAAVFSEPVTGFTASDVTIGGTAGGTKLVTVTNPSADKETFNVSVTGMTTRGTVVATVPAAAVQDGAGNVGTASTSIDNSVTWDRVPSTGVSLNSASPRTNDLLVASATPSDPDGDAVTLSYTWKINGVTKKTTASTSSTTDSFNLATEGNGDKNDLVTVEVTPNDGLFSGSTASASATVVNSPPTVAFTSAPASADEGEAKTYAYSASDADGDVLSLVAGAPGCGANGTRASSSFDPGTGAGSFDCSFPDGPAGSTVSVQVTDGTDGSNAPSQLVAIANVAPTVAFTSAPASADEGQTKTYSYSISDPGTDTVDSVVTSCGGNGTKSNASNSDTGGTFDCTFSDGPASSTVSVQATDSDGAAGNTGTQLVQVANVAPTVTLDGPNPVDEGTSHTYTFSVSDPGEDTFAVDPDYLTCGSGGAYVEDSLSTDASGGSFDCSFPDGPATTSVAVKVTDSDGGSDAASESTKAVSVSNVAPSVGAPTDEASDEGSAHAFDVGSFSDPGPDSPWAVSIDWGDGSSATTFSASFTGSLGTRSHTYADGPNDYTVTVTVSDEDLAADSKTFSVHVANVAPAVNLSGPGTATEGETKHYGYTTSDPGDETFGREAQSCGDKGALSNESFDPSNGSGSFDCTFPDGDASSMVEVTVGDGDGGSGSGSIPVKVANVPPSTPELVSPADGAKTNDATPAFDWGDSTDPAGANDTTTYSLQLDDNCDFSSPELVRNGLGSSEFTPSEGLADGEYCWRARASDEDGGDSPFAGARTLTVDTVKPSSTIAFPGNGGSYRSATFVDGCETGSGDLCGTASDDRSGVDKVEVSIRDESTGHYWDGSAFVPSGTELFNAASGTTSWSYDFTPGPGEYTIHSRAVDRAGNAETGFDEAVFVVDDTPPAAPTLDSTSPASPANDNEPSLDGAAEPNSIVDVYADAACASQVGSGTADGTGHFRISVPVEDDTVTVFHASASDAAGNVSACSDGLAYVEDSTPPTQPIPNSTTPGSPANDNEPLVLGTAEASSTVTLYADDSCAAAPTGTGAADETGHFAIQVHVGDDSSTTFRARARDTAGNLSECSTDSVDYREDSTRPSVTVDQAASQSDPSNATTIHFTAVFSEPVSGLDGSDVSLGGSAGATSVVVSGGPTSYDLAVSGMAADGTVTATIPASGARDGANNGNTASSSTDDTVAYKGSRPSVTIEQAAGQNDPTNASTIHFTAVFSEPVNGFTDSDILLGGSAGPASAVVTDSGDHTTYDVAVSGMASDGNVTAALPAGAAGDSVGNPSTGSTSSDNSVVYDGVRPSVRINQALAQTDPTSTAPIHFTAVFSEPVTGFGNASVTLGGTAGGTLSAGVTQIAPNDGTTYDVKVSGMTTAGTVVATVGANSADDAAGNHNTASASLDNTVAWQPALGNTTPVVTVLQPLFGSVYAKGSAALNPLILKASFSDPDNGAWTWYVNWDDGTPNASGTSAVSGSTFQTTHSYSSPGVYTINVNVKDGAGAVGTAQAWIVVYDPNGGFVTGGGWLNVGAGSFAANPALSGRANFGFNSQYKKNANIPTGDTEFNFQLGGFNFHSTAYSWLVVNGFKAQYRGTGTVNGGGSYDFTLTAYDGDLTGGGGTDRFRIRVTDNNNSNRVVFDNRNGAPTDMDTADPQAIAGGSIVIHKA
jgi:Bacterial Ig domain/PKD domain